MLGSPRGTLVLLPPRVRRRLALCGDHADARASRSPAQRRDGLEVYADAATGAARVGRAVARTRVRLTSRSRAQTAAPPRAAGACGGTTPRRRGWRRLALRGSFGDATS